MWSNDWSACSSVIILDVDDVYMFEMLHAKFAEDWIIILAEHIQIVLLGKM